MPFDHPLHGAGVLTREEAAELVGSRAVERALQVRTMQTGLIQDAQAQLSVEHVCVRQHNGELVSLFAYYSVPVARLGDGTPFDCDNLVADKQRPDCWRVE